MKLDKKMEFYLRDAHIDFTAFHVLDVAPKTEEHAAVLLAPKHDAPIKCFCVQYRGKHHNYGSIENMMIACVEYGWLSQKAADKLTKEYYAMMQEGK